MKAHSFRDVEVCPGRRSLLLARSSRTPFPRLKGSSPLTAFGRSKIESCPGMLAIVERVAGIEPARSAWEADRLPLHHTRSRQRRLGISSRPSQRPDSAAGHRHVPLDRGPRPPRYRSRAARGLPAISASSAASRSRLSPDRSKSAQLDLLVVAEAAIDRPCRRDPDAVAAGAEIVADRRDQAEPRAKLRHVEISGGTAGAKQRRDQRERSSRAVLHPSSGR